MTSLSTIFRKLLLVTILLLKPVFRSNLPKLADCRVGATKFLKVRTEIIPEILNKIFRGQEWEVRARARAGEQFRATKFRKVRARINTEALGKQGGSIELINNEQAILQMVAVFLVYSFFRISGTPAVKFASEETRHHFIGNAKSVQKVTDSYPGTVSDDVIRYIFFFCT